MPIKTSVLSLAACLLIFGLVLFVRKPEKAESPSLPRPTALASVSPSEAPSVTVTVTASPITVPNEIVAPIGEFKQRITKKFFGTYVTPTNSPVQPERFTGYHTGIDVEYTDAATDVPVQAIAAGTVVTSEYASGYGGVMVIRHRINGKTLYAIYGHLRQSSMLKDSTVVTPGERIALLGTGYSSETDGERRHLHFGIATVNTIAGYVSSLAALHASWIDPLSLYP